MADQQPKPPQTQGTINVTKPTAPPPPPAAPKPAAVQTPPPPVTPPAPAFKPNLPPPPPPLPPVNRPPVPVQKSPFRFIIPILIVGIVVLLAIMVGRRFLGSRSNSDSTGTPTQETTITYWGLWEPTAVMQEVIADFESQNPGIKVNYQQQSIKDYRERLQNSLSTNAGPDVFRFHMTWTPLLSGDLAPIPDDVISAKEFDSQQYPVARAWLKSSKGYLGLPLMYEGLGLYYNQSIFEAAGVTPPKTWTELRPLAVKLAIPDKKTGGVQRGGIALGTTTNVDNWQDILGLLLLQNAANPAKPNNQLGHDALTFYTLFTKTDKVWSEAMPTSTVAFATEKVAMMIAPSWRAHEIKEMNPNLKFGIAPVPQLPDTQVSWASVWVEGVSSHAGRSQQQASWKLIQYLNQKEVLRTWYAAASKQRMFGEIFARTDMADQLSTDPMVAAFVTQAPYAKSWFLNSRTFDNGPNDKIGKYYEDALNGILVKGDSAANTLVTVEQGVSQIVSQYRLPASVPEAK